jgi:hypothetical protein
MPDKSKAPRAQIHVTIFLASEPSEVRTFSLIGPLEATPARMKLLAKLTTPDGWRRNLGSEPTTWDAIEAAVAEIRQSN